MRGECTVSITLEDSAANCVNYVALKYTKVRKLAPEMRKTKMKRQRPRQDDKDQN